MRDLVILLVHVITTILRLIRPGGVRAVVAESVLAKHQLLIHRALVKRKYRLLFSPKQKTKPGPKGPTADLIRAVVEMKRRNPTWGCPHIADQINLAFGTSINKDVVRRILAQHYRPMPTEGRQPQNPWRYGNQNRSLYSLVSSVHRAINWNNPTRVFGPVAVLDGNGFGNNTYCVQGLLQQVSNSCWPQGRNAGRNTGI